MNRSKAIGTRAETATLKVIQGYYPDARREILHGAADEGDIRGCSPFIVEVKGGAQTHAVGGGLLEKWLGEVIREAANAGETWGILVLQRKGFGLPNADKWWAFMAVEQFVALTGGFYVAQQVKPVRLELGHLLTIAANLGYAPDAPWEDPTKTGPIAVISA